MATTWVGQNVPRKEGRQKVEGKALYVDDIAFPDMIYGVTVRSPEAHGKITGIEFTGDLPWEEFTIVTAKDIPGKNYVAALETDQPCLADGVVKHAEEPVLLLAHKDKYLLQEARRHVQVKIEPWPAIYTIEDSLNQTHVIRGKDNIIKEYLVNKGNVDEIWEQADHIITGEYTTGAQEHLYIEPNGVIAIADPEQGITIWGSMQCPYYVHKALKPIFGDLEDDKIRVVHTTTGGAFGGKEEYPSILAAHAALLALKSGKPVKIVYDRMEDMAATTKRHPSRTVHKTAVSKDGKLLAIEIDFVLDGGAYATLSSVVLSRGTIHAAGPYHCDNVRIRARAVATNLPPHGAFRGFGAPQSIFAMESHLNKIAEVLGISPVEIRQRNFIQPQQSTATSQVIREKVNMEKILQRALIESDYENKIKAFDEHNRKPGNKIKKGIGLASFMHGAGFTGSGEVFLASIVGVEGTKEGKVRVLAASTEMGQGTNTIFSQITAEALGIDYDMVTIQIPDTSKVPDSGPTVASRTCMIVGKLLQSAALGLKQILQQSGFLGESYTSEEFARAIISYRQKFPQLKVLTQYKHPPNIHWDDEKYQGDAYGAYAWAVYVAEVSVDTLTYQITVDDFVAVQEIGKVMHPILAAGQIEGGVAQGIGYAIYEKIERNAGKMINNQMTNYIIPTAADVTSIRVFFEEEPYEHGPWGAKGIGELPMDGSAPAVVGAVQNALGTSIKDIPVTPEVLFENMEGQKNAAN